MTTVIYSGLEETNESIHGLLRKLYGHYPMLLSSVDERKFERKLDVYRMDRKQHGSDIDDKLTAEGD